MTAALGPFIMRHPDVKNSMEQFMLQHVLPEFISPDPYMRAIVGFGAYASGGLNSGFSLFSLPPGL